MVVAQHTMHIQVAIVCISNAGKEAETASSHER